MIRGQKGVTQPQGHGEEPLLHWTRIFCKFLQAVFSTFPAGSYRWDTDPTKTEVYIGDQAGVAREVVEQRPAILTTRGPASLSNTSMDQFKKIDRAEARRHHIDLIAASMVYNCISKEGLEAQRWAWIAAMATRRLKRSLLRAGLHRVGEDLEIGAESPPGTLVDGGSDNEVVLIQVHVPFFFYDAWTIEPTDKLLLKEVDLALTSHMNYPALGAVVINSPSLNGKPLKYDRTLSLVQRVRASATNRPKPRKAGEP